MERTATDVAPPPIKGGELPSFDELLAKGSFHARLARARVEREKALARSGEETGDEFILDTSRKPWEKEAHLPLKRDRLSEALSHSVALEDPVVRRPSSPAARAPVSDAPDAPKPAVPPPAAPVAAPAAITTIPALLPSESLTVIPPKPRRKRLQVAAGFGAGLVLGVTAAVVGPFLTKGGTAPVTLAPGPVAQAPSVGAAEPVLASLSAVVEPLPAPRGDAPLSPRVAIAYPAAPVSADAAPMPMGQGLALASAAPAVMVPEVTPPQPLPPRPTQFDAVVARGLPLAPASVPGRADPVPSVIAPPTPPRISANLAGLAAVTLPDPEPLGLAAASGWLAPEPGQLSSPETMRDAPLELQPLPAVYSMPAPVAEDTTAPTLFPGPVILNAPSSVAETALADIVGRLSETGVTLGEPNRVGFTVSESNVRYFHAADAEAAAAIAAALDARARDFTSFEPAPPEGTIEVWLAGRGDAASATSSSRKSTNRRQSTTDQRLLNLRNRILQQLRNGDHL